MDVATQSSCVNTKQNQTVCRFCFGKRYIDEIFFDVFKSKIGDKILIDCIKSNFAVLEAKTYNQCLIGQCWTTDYLEVVQYAINVDDTILRGICVKCLQILIEIDSLANKIRTNNLEQFAQVTFEAKLEACDLKTKKNVQISDEQILRELRYKKEADFDGFANLWDTCRFCLRHESILLFDILKSKISDDSIVDVIKMCTATYKQQDVHLYVHLRKNCVKSISVPDYQWPDAEDETVHRQICLDCLLPLIKIKFLIDRIKKTSAGLALMDLSCHFEDYVGINLLHTTLEKMLNKCVLIIRTGDVISTQQVLQTIKLTELSSPKMVEGSKLLVTPYQYYATDHEDQLRKEGVIVKDSAEGNSHIFCRLCNEYIVNDCTVNEHILIHVQAANNNDPSSNICKSCLELFVNEENRNSVNIYNEWMDCSICRLRKYLNNIDDINMTFEEYSKMQFD